MDEAKPFNIPKRVVWKAFKRVKANQGAAGVDRQSIAEFEADLSNNLYKLWNRMCSGSYFPPPVRRVEIPKADGGKIFQQIGHPRPQTQNRIEFLPNHGDESRKLNDCQSECCPQNGAFVDRAAVRFSIFDVKQHYHVPLLCTPGSCTTYRGS